jgi:CheY-like chemotaxis protein
MSNPPLPYRVLVADDDPDTADSTVEVLRLDGHDVRAVYDGRQAVEIAKTFRPHLVILDINMPVMDGYEAASALRKEFNDPDLILVAHTSLTKPDDSDRVRRAGFNHYLHKPPAPGAMRQLVSECLERVRNP